MGSSPGYTSESLEGLVMGMLGPLCLAQWYSFSGGELRKLYLKPVPPASRIL